jgi:hypothetical protein
VKFFVENSINSRYNDILLNLISDQNSRGQSFYSDFVFYCNIWLSSVFCFSFKKISHFYNPLFWNVAISLERNNHHSIAVQKKNLDTLSISPVLSLSHFLHLRSRSSHFPLNICKNCATFSCRPNFQNVSAHFDKLATCYKIFDWHFAMNTK